MGIRYIGNKYFAGINILFSGFLFYLHIESGKRSGCYTFYGGNVVCHIASFCSIQAGFRRFAVGADYGRVAERVSVVD